MQAEVEMVLNEEVTASGKKHEVRKMNNNKAYLFVKRAFDIIVSFGAILILLVPMLIVSALIYIESPGPVIFKQERLGKGGKPFMMYKFRSMRLDAEKNGPQWAVVNDDRCTKIGKIIRVWHIDELPQFVNVLKGEMSIVGPRPEREYFYEEFEKTIHGFRLRLLVDQGLTCIGQVNGCYDLTPEQRLEYDIEYIEKQSVLTDIDCILKTVLVIFNHKGAR